MDGDGEATDASGFLGDVLTGLEKSQKEIPARWFYDEKGSELFDQITALAEYYPTRTERGILEQYAPEISDTLGTDLFIIEYGAGSLEKIGYLLNHLKAPAGYAPVDISGAHLNASAETFRASYPKLKVFPVVADFMQGRLSLPIEAQDKKKVGFFPGSTIGNLSDIQIDDFLKRAREDLGADGRFLIGIDQPKDVDVLLAAYDDSQGVTAAFNLNILERANRELGADFSLNAFKHKAIWNAADSQIEMHLESLEAQTVEIAGRRFAFEKGETIHTENSRKIALPVFQTLAAQTGWVFEKAWSDEKGWFALVLLS